ncbi:response regulator transcription factor [Blastococcus sp. URHD0036]|uniref:response regulator transcription factor n=1 Tax=Blastococcus sp. URHD0036 TaxID=1380356 RepID=UPI0004960EF0|nr:helix-turn-helix transcriptional regulator [Blastococcus sp. URHD0036]
MAEPSAVPEGHLPPGTANLGPRDLELLAHLADGASTAGIATALGVSGNTARTRLRRVQRKLDVPDRRAAVATARDRGLLREPDGDPCS